MLIELPDFVRLRIEPSLPFGLQITGVANSVEHEFLFCNYVSLSKHNIAIEKFKDHDSILQTKNKKIAELTVKAEIGWRDKVACIKDAKNVCALIEEVKTLKSRIATLEKQL